MATAAGPCARRGEAALQADSCSQARDTAWQALAPGRDTHLSQGSQAQPQLLSVRHPGCPVHRGLRANKPFFRQCQRLTSQVFILCLRAANPENAGLDEFTLPPRLAISGYESFVVVFGERPAAQPESEGSLTGDDVPKTGTDESEFLTV